MKVIVTGAGGFIGSCMLHFLESKGVETIGVDDFDQKAKRELIGDFSKRTTIHRDHLMEQLPTLLPTVDAVIHLGARTDTAEMDVDLFDRLNLNYSKQIWRLCAEYQTPLLYASSAATYGGGEYGFEDDHAGIKNLQPLNPYGQSKQDFDLWVLEQEVCPPRWAGFKFFNVYGPNEDFKGRMASVIFHTFHKIKQTGKMQLFRSHKEGIEDGHQSRDFVYVKDVVRVLYHFLMLDSSDHNAIYNLGTGQARTFLDLASQTFIAQGLDPNISFIDTPADIRDKYQYFTEASMEKVRSTGYTAPFTSLEEGIKDYVQEYLIPGKMY
jgi:ADP-L-glycero-D-manno-heptose 6-epimerase